MTANRSAADKILSDPKEMLNSVLGNVIVAAGLELSGLDSIFSTRTSDGVLMNAPKNAAYAEALATGSRIIRGMVPAISPF